MAKQNKTIRKITFMEPRKIRKALTGLDNGGFYVAEESPSYSKKKVYLLGFIRHANANQYRLKKQYGEATTEHVITKDLYNSFVKEAKILWRKHKEVIEPNEQVTYIKDEY
jgi:hypothetical protein